MKKMRLKLAIIGGGPSALMTYKRLVNASAESLSIDIFESSDHLGSGMPYSERGALHEHVSNVSSDEMPDLKVTLAEWILQLPQDILTTFKIDASKFHEKQVVPRLLLGSYLTAQFNRLVQESDEKGYKTTLRYCSKVVDIKDLPQKDQVQVIVESGEIFVYDRVIVCTGHHWPRVKEGSIANYFDSPYPPSKLAREFNHTIIVRGTSLTAVDAIRTMARHNGYFKRNESTLKFIPKGDSPNFKVIMHSRHGLLPCIRVHMQDPHGADENTIDQREIDRNMAANNGFLELDFLFEKGFKEPLRKLDPDFFAKIKGMNIEAFVEAMMDCRESKDPFELFEKEYKEAKASIDEERPVHWKERLAALSFAINYPAKHLSAEDMLRLRDLLMPLISVVIAFLPQESCDELIALHDAGCLEIIADGDRGSVDIDTNDEIIYRYPDNTGETIAVHCKTFVDCKGQPHLPLEDFPFKTLLTQGTVSSALIKFRSADKAKELLLQGQKDICKKNDNYYLKVTGVAITDTFQVVDTAGHGNDRIYLMAVPYMGGFNPDYSGLDFCEHASDLIVTDIMERAPLLKEKVVPR